ncbi:exported hypothetical protein [Rhodococcus ruber]|uniref:Uncharacterized protein n=1 Tax=Rhodococcus ruber TaxID=1830 RepID=A0A098BK52_9NOCA|nr:exported hypothetical protein [Rhodococcus ruber]
MSFVSSARKTPNGSPTFLMMAPRLLVTGLAAGVTAFVVVGVGVAVTFTRVDAGAAAERSTAAGGGGVSAVVSVVLHAPNMRAAATTGMVCASRIRTVLEDGGWMVAERAIGVSV